jgi:hypothetical protein
MSHMNRAEVSGWKLYFLVAPYESVFRAGANAYSVKIFDASLRRRFGILSGLFGREATIEFLETVQALYDLLAFSCSKLVTLHV